MEKRIILILTALFISTWASAQLEIRPTIGINMTNVSKAPDNSSTSAMVGGQGGLSVMIGNRFHVEPGILYFSSRTSYSTDETINNGDFDQTLNGVNIPVNVGFRFLDPTDEPLLNPRIFVGPSMQFLTKTVWSDGMLDEKVDWKNFSWSATVGAGLDISFLFVDFGYSWGLSNVATPRDQVEEFNDFKNNTFFVNVGARLRLVK